MHLLEPVNTVVIILAELINVKLSLTCIWCPCNINYSCYNDQQSNITVDITKSGKSVLLKAQSNNNNSRLVVMKEAYFTTPTLYCKITACHIFQWQYLTSINRFNQCLKVIIHLKIRPIQWIWGCFFSISEDHEEICFWSS